MLFFLPEQLVFLLAWLAQADLELSGIMPFNPRNHLLSEVGCWRYVLPRDSMSFITIYLAYFRKLTSRATTTVVGWVMPRSGTPFLSHCMWKMSPEVGQCLPCMAVLSTLVAYFYYMSSPLDCQLQNVLDHVFLFMIFLSTPDTIAGNYWYFMFSFFLF